ncbi:leucyl aminopeptidase [Agitococcus lubricus]|uniref:Probable cytosol aminopeptidase n=1 Tax=Agitococcus lubricus TaxID=1077255 RepID=A0A2T5IYJ5_9GAMM|nr:leucyl aminopeptidase [Agitococcus lubricus]PTQ89066.1 aminopeptidase A [Agitococcus lubricus]
MEFALLPAVNAALVSTDTLIIAMTTDGLTATGQAIDLISGGALTSTVKAANFEAKLGQTLSVYHLNHISSPIVLVVGAGDSKDFNGRALQKVASSAYKALNKQVQSAYSFLAELSVLDRSPSQVLSELSKSTLEASYQFQTFKSKKTSNSIEKMTFVVDESLANTAGQQALAWGEAVALGQNFARDLGNLPPNVCHPSYLAEQATLLAKGQRKLSVEILGEKEMEKLGMGAFLAVSKGSEQEGKLIVMNYTGGKKGEKPVVLVGKGITFDTGGISIKPAAGMDEMKFDMCGAASVFGVMKGILAAKLPINVVCVVAAAENMPSGRATRPSDIVTTMSGQTVEILNTDAEGRLVLCDALTYVKKYDPAIVIDIATLTGACVVALGKVVSGLFSPSDELANDILQAGEQSNDRAWRMPVLPDYQELLDSPFADIGNIGGPNGGAITAACFLARFTKDYTWAHLDIAGTAWLSGAQKGATGRPVPLLMHYLSHRAKS